MHAHFTQWLLATHINAKQDFIAKHKQHQLTLQLKTQLAILDHVLKATIALQALQLQQHVQQASFCHTTEQEQSHNAFHAIQACIVVEQAFHNLKDRVDREDIAQKVTQTRMELNARRLITAREGQGLKLNARMEPILIPLEPTNADLVRADPIA